MRLLINRLIHILLLKSSIDVLLRKAQNIESYLLFRKAAMIMKNSRYTAILDSTPFSESSIMSIVNLFVALINNNFLSI